MGYSTGVVVPGQNRFQRALSALTVKPVLVGAAIDIGGSFSISTVVGMILGFRLAASGVSGAELPARLTEALQSGGMQAFAMTSGLIFTAVGGYVAAHLADRERLAHAIAVGCVSTLLGLLMVLFTETAGGFLFNLLAFTLTIPAAAFGGSLRANRS